ncbi:MAG: hypothetical protein EBT63_01270 [Proteobacteria bacterium]|nr:hypothetical protein [Pseudomonadota bacterium]
MIKRNLVKILCGMIALLVMVGCNSFSVEDMLYSKNANECRKRDWTIHRNPYPNGNNPGRINIDARQYRCRIERICVGKSKAENEKCKIDAGNYWGFDYREGYKGYEAYRLLSRSDDQSDAICALNRNPWDHNFKGCSPKFKPQENYETNPYFDKKTKTYILPEKIEK